jgi:transcriptional regulator with XRE-family HTH domain
MDQSIAQQFGRALVFLLEKEGRGAQTRLAREQGIDRGYLNAIIQGRKTGSENVRSKIADYFRMPYEEMLALGRRLLEGGSDILEKDYLVSEQKEEHINVHVAEQTPEYEKGVPGEDKKVSTADAGSVSIADKIQKVIEILETDTENRFRFAELIDTFHDSLKTKKENAGLRRKLSELDQRIDQLEKNKE